MARWIFSSLTSLLCLSLVACDAHSPSGIGQQRPSRSRVISASRKQMVAENERRIQSRVESSHSTTVADRIHFSNSTTFVWGPDGHRVHLVIDRFTHSVTATVRSDDKKTRIPISNKQLHLVIDAPLTEIVLVAKPVKGDADGTCSQFVATNPVFGLQRPLSGSLSALVDKQPCVTDFSESYDLFASRLQ